MKSKKKSRNTGGMVITLKLAPGPAGRLRRLLKRLHIPESFIPEHLADAVSDEFWTDEHSSWVSSYVYPSRAVAMLASEWLFKHHSYEECAFRFYEQGKVKCEELKSPYRWEPEPGTKGPIVNRGLLSETEGAAFTPAGAPTPAPQPEKCQAVILMEEVLKIVSPVQAAAITERIEARLRDAGWTKPGLAGTSTADVSSTARATTQKNGSWRARIGSSPLTNQHCPGWDARGHVRNPEKGRLEREIVR